MLKDQLAWLFESPPAPIGEWSAILWWEQRRVPFNLFMVGYAIPCFVVFIVALSTSGYLQPDEDAVEPLAIVGAPFVINVLYTLGWFVEVPARIVVPCLSPRFGPTLLKLGMGLGLFLISIPAVFWGGYRILQLIRFVQ